MWSVLSRYALGGVLFLAGCATQAPQFSVPEQITFWQETFEKVSHSQIDEMQQLLYLPQHSAKNPDNWQKGILLFLDKNSQGRTLQQRAELRKQRFAQQPQTLAKVELKAVNGTTELQSQVIYPPTERFADVQLEVSRGQDLNCGFGQMQFADKRAVTAKKVQNLAEFQPLVLDLAVHFSQLAWQIECK